MFSKEEVVFAGRVPDQRQDRSAIMWYLYSSSLCLGERDILYIMQNNDVAVIRHVIYYV